MTVYCKVARSLPSFVAAAAVRVRPREHFPLHSLRSGTFHRISQGTYRLEIAFRRGYYDLAQQHVYAEAVEW